MEVNTILIVLRILLGIAITVLGLFVLRHEYRKPEPQADFDRLLFKYGGGAAFVIMGVLIIIGGFPY